MPTQSTTYNTRVTDEALEKRFRDTFRSQGGAELVDDLYASGVIIPVVDFTAAAEGSALRSDLQTAWDFATGTVSYSNSSGNVVTTTGFWKVRVSGYVNFASSGAQGITLSMSDGISSKNIWTLNDSPNSSNADQIVADVDFVVFLASGESLTATATDQAEINVFYRQIADVSGNFTNPSGFTSS